MTQFSIKEETENLVRETQPYLNEITPHIAIHVFDIIRDHFHDEYAELCEQKDKNTVNQWIGKAIAAVFRLWNDNEKVRLTGDDHLVKTYRIFYQL